VAQTVTIGEQKVCPESLKFSTTPTPQVENPSDSDSSTPTPQPCDAHTRKGISFDGMFPSACKFPLGRPGKPGRLNSAELIRPVSKMLKYLSSEKELKNGYHLADVLTSTCFVCGEEIIYKLFARQADKVGLKIELMEKQLIQDIKKFSPIDNLSNILSFQKWNMKRVVYRSTTLLVAALGKHFRVKGLGNTAFNTTRKLAKTEIISPMFSKNLLIALAVACYVRLSVYCKNNRQEDW